MINRLRNYLYVVAAIILLFTHHGLAGQIDNGLNVQPTLGYSVPAPLELQFSNDGMTLYYGVSPVVYVDNPDPFHKPLRIPAPMYLLSLPEYATATFSITYVPNGGTDLWGESCFTFPDEAKAAFDAAANIWATLLQTSVPITIKACWADLGSSSILGYSGGGNLYRDFAGALRANTWYTESLANALAGSDLGPSAFDMHITYNRNFSWYYGTDGNTPPGQYDLMSVVLHEITHGLNFSGSMQYLQGRGRWGYGTGYPNIYDTFVVDGSGNLLINTAIYPNSSSALGTALTSGDIWFQGSNAMAANSDQRVKIYAPFTWSSGSSYSHLDYDTFNNTINQLMVYAISAGESIHDPGPVTEGLLRDLGWNSSGLPAVTITANDATATEAGPSTGQFTVTRTGVTTSPLTVYYNVGGTATAGSDYNSIGTSVTIPAGSATATITVTPINDTEVEGDETVVVTLSANAAYTVGAPNSATVTITSDDGASLPTVVIRAIDATATEAGTTTGLFGIRRTGATTSPLTVYYNVGGTATAGSDYNSIGTSVTIPAGSATATITVRPINDTEVESNETVVVTLSANASYIVGVPNNATVTITSDD